jgi:hypothetical protein
MPSGGSLELSLEQLEYGSLIVARRAANLSEQFHAVPLWKDYGPQAFIAVGAFGSQVFDRVLGHLRPLGYIPNGEANASACIVGTWTVPSAILLRKRSAADSHHFLDQPIVDDPRQARY